MTQDKSIVYLNSGLCVLRVFETPNSVTTLIAIQVLTEFGSLYKSQS